MVMMINIGYSVDVISRERIKPSSPTPHTHKTFQLSFLDQLLPTFYVPVIFFYPKPDHANDDLIIARNIQNLKTSFSEVLSLYYPLAGQLDPESLTVVDCNDAGAQFVQAHANARMDDIIQDPQMDQLLKYLPLDPNTVMGSSVDDARAPLLAVQLTLFDCGGIALGVCSSHQLTDAVSLIAFIASWAQISRQGQNGKLTTTPPPTPVFDLARHFPPRDDLSGSRRISHVPTTCEEKREKIATKRFVFDAEKLAALGRAVTSAAVKDPTRVELITAFIWRCVIEAGSKNKVSAAWHVVNLRPRIKSRPMLENVFGNCILTRFVLSEGGGECHELVSGLRNGLREVDEEFICRAVAGSKDDDEEEGCNNNYLKDIRKFYGMVGSGEMESCGFSSWSRLPVYEMDFGFMGKPVWVCPATNIPDRNFVFLMGTKDGAGVELWVTMFESALQLLDIKFQLLVAKSQV